MEDYKIDLVGFSNEVLKCARELGIELAISPNTLYLVGTHGITAESRTALLTILINLKTMFIDTPIKEEDKETGLALIDSYIDFLLMKDLESLNIVH